MFSFRLLPPNMECYIDHDKLVVKRPCGLKDLEVDLAPNNFVRERNVIKDERRLVSFDSMVSWAIGTEDGYTIVGTSDDLYVVLDPKGYMISNGRWDSASVSRPMIKIGIHASNKKYHAIFLNSCMPNVLQVAGTFYYAECEASLWEDFYSQMRNGVDIDYDTAMPLYTHDYSDDSYYIVGCRSDTGIIQKYCDTPENVQYLDDRHMQEYNAFWRYVPYGEIYPFRYNNSGPVGPYELSYSYETKYGRYAQHIPREYALRFLVHDPEALAVYVVNEQVVHTLYKDHIDSRQVRMQDLRTPVIEKAQRFDMKERDIPTLFHVGYKATKPLLYGVKPDYIKLYSDMSGAIVGEPDLKLEHPSLNPPLSIYRDIVSSGATYGYIDAFTNQVITL